MNAEIFTTNLLTPLTVSEEALLWRPGNEIVRLGDLEGGTFNSVALGVSGDGVIVVGEGSSNRGKEAFIWDDSNKMRNLRSVLIDLGLDLTRWQLEQATGISEDGSIITGTGSNPQGETVAWVANISSPNLFNLGGLGGSERISSRAYAISDDGSTVVGESESANGTEAFRWTAAQEIIGLGDLPGGEFESIANAVSADGQVVVGYGQSDKGREAFRWTQSEGMVALGDLASGDFESEALAVSANGTIIGYGTDKNGTVAFIWDAANGMRSLSDVLLTLNISLEGWFLEQATEISSDGQTIVGLGRSPQGRDQAWQVTLNPGSAVQGVEPSGNSANQAQDLSPSGSVVVGRSFSIINNPPRVTKAIADQTNTSNLTYRYQIPSDTFTDVGDSLTYRVVVAGSNSLPTWLRFDAATRTLEGTPTLADLGTLSLEIIATDTSNASAREPFNLTIYPNFDPLQYLASHPDLIRTYGLNPEAATLHYLEAGRFEARVPDNFDEYRYLASSPDLLAAYGSDVVGATVHYVEHGFQEGRNPNSFDAYRYIAGYEDLIKAFGVNTLAGSRHYVESGRFEGRNPQRFPDTQYIASHDDLIRGYGYNGQAGSFHYALAGFNENRSVDIFKPDIYIASDPQRIQNIGYNLEAGTRHFIELGFNAGVGRGNFDPIAYRNLYPDLTVFGDDTVSLTRHYITAGYGEGRVWQ